MSEKWYIDYFGESTKRIIAYLDSKDRVFLIPQGGGGQLDSIPLPESHNCDEMGCGSVGPHIVAIHLNARKYNDSQAKNKRLRTAIDHVIPMIQRDGGKLSASERNAIEILQEALK